MSNSQAIGMNKLLLIVTLILMCFGIAVIYSASAPVASSRNLPAEYYLKAHLFKVLGAVVILGVFYKIDYALWKVLARVIFGFGAILTLAAIVSGGEVKGASRWIWGIQPSEIMKFGFITWVCSKLSNAGDEIKSIKCTIVQPAVPLAISAILLVCQPNFSMLIMFCVLLLVMLMIAGANYKYVGLSVLVSMPLGLIALLLKPHSRSRILAHFSADGTMTASQWQGRHALEALGNGGFFGTGIGMGEQKLGYLPEAHKDVVYSVIGEEFGFVGTFAVLLAFAILFSQGYNIARSSTTRFGRYMAVALTTSLFLNFVIHVCVCVGLIPTTGQPLPFLSFGGTNLMFSAAFIGILLNISRSTSGKSIREPYMSSTLSFDTSRFMNFRTRRSSI
ncbi:putative peptidoglycan glycosyltransferase FtsW [Fibrobacter sp. UWB16]|jgi:cell division protein FtsW|uniref:peptidoglycan glycosyltransferase FtsW n=1 Tax=Fibrobacter sp. UWB16 TaxID=1945874 RepID=UPI000BE27F1C|nr:putative peptidoglycan glycosyltransferase FtsW [Fibrobacter sp. UWB16]MBP5439757.1 cell division protein FtsW [Fibrobacter sp.]